MSCDKRSSFGLCQLPATEATVAREKGGRRQIHVCFWVSMWLQTVRNSMLFGCCQIQITFVYRHLYIYQCLSQICMSCDKRSSFGLCQLPATEAIVAREKGGRRQIHVCFWVSMWLQTVRNSMMFGCCQIQITFVYRHLYIYQCLSQICMSCDKRSSFGLCQLPATEAIVARE